MKSLMKWNCSCCSGSHHGNYGFCPFVDDHDSGATILIPWCTFFIATIFPRSQRNDETNNWIDGFINWLDGPLYRIKWERYLIYFVNWSDMAMANILCCGKVCSQSRRAREGKRGVWTREFKMYRSCLSAILVTKSIVSLIAILKNSERRFLVPAAVVLVAMVSVISEIFVGNVSVDSIEWSPSFVETIWREWWCHIISISAHDECRHLEYCLQLRRAMSLSPT